VHPTASPCKRHRFPGEIISHAVWLSYRFLLSYRDVEELLAERGIAVTYETIRRWCHKFGQTFADGLRRRRARPGVKSHMDKVQLKINGRKCWLWRAVDQDGLVLDLLVQERRHQEAAECFLSRLVEGHGYQPRVALLSLCLPPLDGPGTPVYRGLPPTSRKRRSASMRIVSKSPLLTAKSKYCTPASTRPRT
jgi:hypothetical protein